MSNNGYVSYEQHATTSYLVYSMSILPASGSAMTAKASCERSMVPRHPAGQRSTILTVTLRPVQGCGTPWLVAPVQVTTYRSPQAAPLSQKTSLAAAIVVPSAAFPKHADAALHHPRNDVRS